MNTLESSLVLAALVDRDPAFRQLPVADASDRITSILQAFYAECDPLTDSLFTFAARWIEQHPLPVAS